MAVFHRRFACLTGIVSLVVLVACSPAVVTSPEQAQAYLFGETATARVGLTQNAVSTAEEFARQTRIADDRTSEAVRHAHIETEVALTVAAPALIAASGATATAVWSGATEAARQTQDARDLANARNTQTMRGLIADAEAREAQARSARDWADHITVLGGRVVDVMTGVLVIFAVIFLFSSALAVWALNARLVIWSQANAITRLPTGEILRHDPVSGNLVTIYTPPQSSSWAGGDNGRHTPASANLIVPDVDMDAGDRQAAIWFLRRVMDYHAAHPDYPKNKIPTKTELGWGGTRWGNRVNLIRRYLVVRGAGGKASDSGTFVKLPYRDVADLLGAIQRVKTPTPPDQPTPSEQ